MRPVSLAIVLIFTLWPPLPSAGAQGNIAAGRELSIKHCSRCHVVGDHNPFGGIGSTPSFAWMTELPDYAERLRTFYARRPHPTFARVPGYPKWSNAPASVREFTITVDEIEDILSYVETLKVER